MPASDEIPAGVTVTASGAGANAVATFPATTGVAWKLTSASCAGNSGYTGEYALSLTAASGDGLFTYPLGLDNGNAAAALDAIANCAWEGEILFSFGASLVVTAAQTGALNTILIATAEPVLILTPQF